MFHIEKISSFDLSELAPKETEPSRFQIGILKKRLHFKHLPHVLSKYD